LKLTLQASAAIAVIFAIICLSVAITGFNSLADIADPIELADAKGFAWFWTFLASVAAGFGLLGWWLVRTQTGGEDA
jgi:hypothetical protein